MTIKGERILLRPLLPSDFPKIVKWTNDPDVGHYMDDDGYPETLKDCQNGTRASAAPPEQTAIIAARRPLSAMLNWTTSLGVVVKQSCGFA